MDSEVRTNIYVTCICTLRLVSCIVHVLSPPSQAIIQRAVLPLSVLVPTFRVLHLLLQSNYKIVYALKKYVNFLWIVLPFRLLNFPLLPPCLGPLLDTFQPRHKVQFDL